MIVTADHDQNAWSDWDDADEFEVAISDPGYHDHAEDANTVRIHPDPH